MNLKCVATAGGLAVGIGAAVFKVVTRRQPSEFQEPVEPDTTDVVEDVVDDCDVTIEEPEPVDEEATEETEETENSETEEEVFECDEPGCESTFDSEHGLAIHSGKVH